VLGQKLICHKTNLVTYDPNLTEKMLPTLRAAGKDKVVLTPAVMGAEDFSFYQDKIPGLYFFRWRSQRKPISETAPHHT
jgi:metal-dependent amidase/aminoacylase/carboxypeptidase family protein